LYSTCKSAAAALQDSSSRISFPSGHTQPEATVIVGGVGDGVGAGVGAGARIVVVVVVVAMVVVVKVVVVVVAFDLHTGDIII